MDTRKHNKQYLGLDDKQYDEHCRIMRLKMSEWPSGLIERVRKTTGAGGGDALACMVADWIKVESVQTERGRR